MTAASEEGTENNGSAEPGAHDADTQEYSDVDLAAFAHRSKPHDNNGDLKSPWARLVSVDKNFPNIELANSEVYVGRADVVSASGKEDLHISKAHCKIWRSGENGSCYIQNLSVNGTTVQGKPIEKDLHVVLHQGDEVALGPHPSGCPVFIFQIINKVQLGQQKRGPEVEADTAAVDVAEHEGETAPCPKRPKMMENLETFKCSICLNVWHDVVSLTPCLHSFCNSCFSDWYRRSRKIGTECKCPQCRGTVTSASRNHTLRGLVEDILKEDPDLCPSPEHILEMEKKSLFKAGSESQFKFGKDRWADDEMQESTVLSSDDEEDDEEDEEEEYSGCFQCSVHGEGDDFGGFQCAPDQPHLTCSGCTSAFPERPDLEHVAQKCQVCTKAYCRSYWESQSHVLSLPLTCLKIEPMASREYLEMPIETYSGNTYEQEVTRQYMAEQGLTLQAVMRDWLPRLDTGQAGQPRNALHMQQRVTSCSAVCDKCAEEVIAHLLYEFRRFVPKTELPPDAAGRPDCWYGHECRTQIHKESHARKLNHVCDPTTRNSLAR
ncbi:E3 ubiquitin-protein ligase CHFR [Marchantia polymorpha subsp. ruderalis]|uniref:RING-type E3 ubiquitin transferase n=2 Tax=Marchantia polymorpha TaxID=3197 RepID=A0AAF6BYK2_MARPO|nr:hypothetical protein MARPO_0003s0196 [Marchantia polymorpha]BBN17086.1 hypothetical protein Mp_7g11850 [Marchantia polymorpha subsp. ruderalis]|eukprot:PTQ49322.1 hypothetical protein MARPO_0003s0196 [Marchantia polymorpha]